MPHAGLGRLSGIETLPQLAATAHRHSLTAVTRNTPDFENTGVKVLNPF